MTQILEILSINEIVSIWDSPALRLQQYQGYIIMIDVPN